MGITRREALIGLGAGLAEFARGLPAFAAADEVFAACRREPDGAYAAVIFSPDAGDAQRVTLPDRGHDLAQRPGSGECVAMARRPGRFGVAFGAQDRAPVWFASAPARHFYGHAVFSADGRLLFTTENDYEAGRGVIGVRDAAGGYRQIGEFPSHGVDPHDLLLAPDGVTLIVANGGIATHPESGRAALNGPAMEASLAYVDARSGALVEKVALKEELRKLSIRHLALTAAGEVVFGCQYEGAPGDMPPLIGFHRPGASPQLVAAPGGLQPEFRNYVGSVAACGDGSVVAASSPRGGLAGFWDAASRRWLGARRLEDVCGLCDASGHRGFAMTSGLGWIETHDPDRDGPWRRAVERRVNWDNHLIRLKL